MDDIHLNVTTKSTARDYMNNGRLTVALGNLHVEIHLYLPPEAKEEDFVTMVVNPHPIFSEDVGKLVPRPARFEVTIRRL
jgi:hypothetical protein